MRFASTILLAVSALASLACAQGSTTTTTTAPSTALPVPTGGANRNQNPISSPLGGTLEAGTRATITWNPTFGTSVNLVLRRGDENNLDEIETIATGISNNGAFVWSIPRNLVAGNDYSIQIISGAESNYSPLFTVDSDVLSSSSSSSSTSSSTSASSSSSSSGTTSSAVSPTATETEATAGPSTTAAPSNSSTTIRTSTQTPASTSPSAPSESAENLNAGAHLASPLALVLCVFAGLIYLN